MNDHITICICTYHRKTMLEHLLRKLALQNTGGLFDYSIVVVDNDVAGSARDTVYRLKAELGLDITYDIEKENTIPAARNHALRLARGNYIAIIDDDEFPPQHWLITMYRTLRTFDVDGCLGPVHPYFETNPPRWLVKSKMCERPVHRTGTVLQWDQTRTGNVLLKKEVFDKHQLWFDETLRTSGSDRVFFREAMKKGCRFIAVEEAPVYEIVPTERWTKRYYINRAIVHGFNSYHQEMSQLRGISRMFIPLKVTGATFVYALALPLSACLGSAVLMNCLVRGGHHMSGMLAMFGIELIKKRDF